METALFVQINQKNWYIFSMNVTIPKSFGETSPYIQENTGYICDLNSKDVLYYFESKSISVNFMLNLIILFGKFHIHKSKINNSKPCLKVFMVDVHSYMDSLQFIDSKKCKNKIELAKELNLVEKWSNICCLLDY